MQGEEKVALKKLLGASRKKPKTGGDVAQKGAIGKYGLPVD